MIMEVTCKDDGIKGTCTWGIDLVFSSHKIVIKLGFTCNGSQIPFWGLLDISAEWSKRVANHVKLIVTFSKPYFNTSQK